MAVTKNNIITEKEMFEKSFRRPSNFFSLNPQEQWDIDKILGILDWDGTNMTKEELKRFKAHYDE